MNRILFAALVMLLVSCSNDDSIDNKAKSLVFGSFAGECFGDCFQVFRIDNNQLEEDRITNFYGENYNFDGNYTFSDEEFSKYSKILNEIPGELIEGNDKTFGCPDCADQGGIYIQIQSSTGKTITYSIDTDDTDDQSEALVTFKTDVIRIIRELQ